MENMREQNSTTENDLGFTEYGAGVFTVTPLDASIIQSAADGDEKAFEKLFMGTYRYVFATVRKYLKNDQDAYDAIQDTYARVYKGLPHLQSVSSFYPWLHRIAENCAKNVLRQNSCDVLTPLDDAEAHAIAVEQTQEAEVSADITEVLKSLPPQQVDLLVRVYYDKMRVSEIARMQGIPATTVYNRLKAAKKKLKELLKIRDIEKPIYSGEFISMVSIAIRNAIGTELLSMAVAEEILHIVVHSTNKKGAVLISRFARRERSRAALKIASFLLLACLLISAIALLAVGIISKSLFRPVNTNTVSTSTADTPTQTSNTALTTTDAFSQSTLAGTATIPTSARHTVPTSKNTSTAKSNNRITLVGSLEISENFGTFAEDGYLGIATTKERIYAVENGNLAIRSTTTPVFIDSANRNFDELYGESGCFLNVFENKVYWINQNSDSRFVLNRCNLDGSEHYAKVFDAFDCTFLTNMLVARDGVYFLAGVHGQHEHIKSATLYRADFDFNVQDTLENVADYTLIKDTIYYLYGYGNHGVLFSADRDTFENRTNISLDQLSYGSIHSTGDILVLGEYNKYGHSESSSCYNLTVIDSATGKTARIIHGEAGECFEVKDVSPFNGGTVMYNHNGVLKKLNITTGDIENMRIPCGTVHGKYKYLIDEGTLKACEVDSDVYLSWH